MTKRQSAAQRLCKMIEHLMEIADPCLDDGSHSAKHAQELGELMQATQREDRERRQMRKAIMAWHEMSGIGGAKWQKAHLNLTLLARRLQKGKT